VCSEETPLYQSAMNGSLLRFEMEAFHNLLLDGCTRQWGLAGVPFDCYELHDLAHPDFPGEQYKLFIFVNCAKVSSRAAEGINRWKRDGKTHCWTFAAACLDEEKFDAAMSEELIGMRLGCHRTRRNIHIEMNGINLSVTRGDSSLNFGSEASIGPVFYVDDSRARVLGTLRDGGEAGFALREHSTWKSVYLAMLNFGPQLMRNLAEYSDVHVWCGSNDVLYANRSLLCLHTAWAGEKVVDLPNYARVTDLLRGQEYSASTKTIQVTSAAYRTHLWRLEHANSSA
jgi:hypothetical protein